jgi:hypothetical protein
MANSAQLSKNNQNAQVWINWGENTERDFKSCIKEVFEGLKDLYPEREFVHKGSVNNETLMESFNRYSPSAARKLNGSNGGGSNPDGGVIYVRCKGDKWMPVFIGENKHQEDNPGNALERALKNITFFKNLLIAEDYFPYLINVNGPIVNDKKGSYFDRITQDGGFMPVNEVHVKSDPAKPRLRPFTFILDKDFDYEKVKLFSLEIINESMDYLEGKE